MSRDAQQTEFVGFGNHVCHRFGCVGVAIALRSLKPYAREQYRDGLGLRRVSVDKEMTVRRGDLNARDDEKAVGVLRPVRKACEYVLIVVVISD